LHHAEFQTFQKKIKMEKKNQNQKFLELVSKMETLQENEKGKLKGGFTSLSGLVAEAAPLMNNCKNSCPKGCVSAEA
jgi:hypothetical protein